MKNIITLLLALVLLLGASALADDRADMLVAAAVNELGYSATKGGYSKYGEWGGSAYGEWCSEFVSWCVNFADEYYGTSMLGSDYPLQTSCEGGSMWYKERGRYVTVNGGLRGEEGQFYLSDGVSVADRPYIPQKGDLIYIEWYKYNRLDHVGIVEMVTQDADGYSHTWLWNNLRGQKNVKIIIWDDDGRKLTETDASTPMYYNKNGGKKYHTNARCSSVKSRYLPLSAITYGDLSSYPYTQLSPCTTCGAPERPEVVSAWNSVIDEAYAELGLTGEK